MCRDMTIIEDSRQHVRSHDHLYRWWDSHGISYSARDHALCFGDYIRDGSNVSIDTKKDIAELCMDVGRDHERFARELARARDAGYRMVILVEAGKRYNDASNLYAEVSHVCRRCRFVATCHPLGHGGCQAFRHKPMQPATMAKICDGLAKDYGARFEFCDKRTTARRICELLGITI